MELPFHHSAKPKTFENARFLKKVPTEAEALLWRNLRSKKLKGNKFRRQHPIDHFIVDFYCHERKLVIEVDGGIHLKNDNTKYDKARTEKLTSLGLSLILFTNDDVLHNMSSVLKEIERYLVQPPA